MPGLVIESDRNAPQTVQKRAESAARRCGDALYGAIRGNAGSVAGMEDSLFGKPARNFAPRTIWTGDNLDILRGINSETVDLIYLDPPFNSQSHLLRAYREQGRRCRVRGYLDTRQRGRGVDGVDCRPAPGHPQRDRGRR